MTASKLLNYLGTHALFYYRDIFPHPKQFENYIQAISMVIIVLASQKCEAKLLGNL